MSIFAEASNLFSKFYQKYHLSETNSKFAPENGWLEYDCFLLGFSFRDGTTLLKNPNVLAVLAFHRFRGWDTNPPGHQGRLKNVTFFKQGFLLSPPTYIFFSRDFLVKKAQKFGNKWCFFSKTTMIKKSC